MELKMKYHYSYFIYPYVIKEINFNKYIKRLMNHSKFKPKFFDRTKNNSIYEFFLPSLRKYMFPSFEISTSKYKSFHSIDETLNNNFFKNSSCMIFEYDIGKDAQAKAGEDDGIFFKIEKMEVICFKPGICFLTMKTNIEDTDRFSDFLNFNVKFRGINSKSDEFDTYNNIKIQTSTFGDIRKFSEVIHEITGSMQEAKKIDIDINKFLVYSYACLDQEYWNENKPFNEIEKEFSKFANVLNSEYNSEYNNERLKIVNLGNYIKIGISNMGVNLLTTSVNTVNYTNLPFEFENEYFYAYIFSLYEKFYLSKLVNDFGKNLKSSKASKAFFKFTDRVWVHLLTGTENGAILVDKIREALELERFYGIAKEQYDVAYKNFKMRNSEIVNKIVMLLLAVSVITNIINFISLYRLK